MSTPASSLNIPAITDSAAPARPRAPLPGWMREPLLHFVLLGGLLFVVDAVIAARADDPRAILMSAEVDNQAKELFKAQRSRHGQSCLYTLTASQPKVQLYGSANDPRGRAEIASAYTVLGIEHILTGYDHLLFVFVLLFLVGFQRKLLWTITAFTAAHSLTLACAALGLLTLRSPPVEATISVVDRVGRG
jgi:HupE / UreJ protein